jgi:hypothetical protein
MNKILAWLGVTLAAACSRSGPVDVTTEAAALRIQNASDSPVYFFVVGRQRAALINWAPCTAPPSCPSVQPHAERLVPVADIGEREAIVYWWHLIPAAGDGFQVDAIRAIAVSLLGA